MTTDATSSAPGQRSLGHYEMLWDCGYCDAKGLLGITHRHCPQCGAPQDETRRYFPPEGQEQKVADHRFVGADRVCGSCNTAQAAAAAHCGTCGAPLGDAPAARLVATPAAQPTPRRGAPRWLWPVLAIVVIGLGGLIYWRCRTTTTTMQVAGHQWARAIAIEELAEVTDATWRDQVPADGRLGTCSARERSQRQVEDGQTCTTDRHDRGDGTFEMIETCRPTYRSEPVMDTWCEYRADRWREVQELRATGEGLDARWPEVPTLAAAVGRLGDRRVGARRERYTVALSTGGRTQRCDVGEATWRRLAPGSTAKVTIRAASGDVVCGDL
ncbi:MAG: hypothetical protein R2939_00955 [Kofleriaceae bacterium]